MIPDALYQSILDHLPHAVIIVSKAAVPETEPPDFTINYANAAWEQISGARTSTIVGKAFSATVYSKSIIPWHATCAAVFADGKTVQQTCYSEIVEKWLEFTATRIDGDHACFHIRDVTEQKQAEIRLKEQNLRLSSLSSELTASRNNLKVKLEKIETLNESLEQLAYYDALTNLPNRTRFQNILIDTIEIAARNGEKFAIAIIDIDNMKTLNDSSGHASGDELLRQIAQRLASFESNGIEASRFGGDEFLLLIRNYDHDAALEHLTDSIQETLHEAYMIFNAEIRSTVSIGVTAYPDDAERLQELLKYADIALDDAKGRGKKTTSFFHAVMQERLLSRLNMEKKMFLALENERFFLNYQPQYDAQSGRLRGFEALVRWNDAELGSVSPERFIPIAEETRAIITLGDWIMRTACRTLAAWQRDLSFDGILSVNVSPIQLKASGFLDDLKGIIAENGFNPKSLEIEITEGVLIDDFDSSVALLRSIKDLGVGISLDDFGTGYSSLSYLQFLPLTTLKIDKSFIANITLRDSVEYDITDAIVNLVNKLGLDTIAEGVETEEQLEIIKRIHCHTVQGFLTGRPMLEADCAKMIKNGFYSVT
jgi:diguanylate cyclase (GGDEF)-like protein